MLRAISKLYVLALIACMLPFSSLQASAANATNDPAGEARIIQNAITQTQIQLSTGDPEGSNSAKESLASALQEYQGDMNGELEKIDSTVAKRLRLAFQLAEHAVQTGNEREMAVAKSQITIGMLAGSYTVADQALASGNGTKAKEWLRLREFRQTTRFSRPNTDGTIAVEEFIGGKTTADDARARLSTDLLDTYQARMSKSLQDLTDAETKGFSVRRAEHAAAAESYFAIISKAYRVQKGDTALQKALDQFAALRSAAMEGKSVASKTSELQRDLRGFRAAPLTLEEKKRRAGQISRFIGLISVEYGRAIGGGKVIKDFEVIEASSFHTGAVNAFEELQGDLEAFDPDKTAEMETLLKELKVILAGAMAQTQVAAPKEVTEKTDRLHSLFTGMIPSEWTKRSIAGDFDTVISLLDQVESAVASGQFDMAESARLEAYAVMETGPEPRIVAFAPHFKPVIEGLFWNGYHEHPGMAKLISQHASKAEIKAERKELENQLGKAQDAIGGSNSSATAVSVNTATIVFREGLEAVLILAALMAGLQRGAYSHLRKPLWWGAMAALGATAITWLLARGLLSSLARFGEHLEAIVSLIAVAVLLLITNWFFHKTYWSGWLQNFQKKKGEIARGDVGQYIGMIILGFTSIYREGFETVLFLQAMVLDAGTNIVMGGIGLGMVGVIAVGLLLFLVQVKLPYKKMLIITGVMISSVLVTMVGMTIHVFQVVGWLTLHPIRAFEFPYWASLWFGLYATWEGIILQAASFVFVLGSYFLAKALTKSKRKETAAAASGTQSA
jgi:high-affinity iron transporter